MIHFTANIFFTNSFHRFLFFKKGINSLLLSGNIETEIAECIPRKFFDSSFPILQNYLPILRKRTSQLYFLQ